MKARVIRAYRDKRTKEVHRAGDTVDVTKTRLAEINAASGGPYLEEDKKDAGEGNAG